MVTSIQLNENVKKILDRLKTEKQTYEDVVLNLIKFSDEQKRKQRELMVESAKEMYGDMIEMSKEWENALMDGLDKDEKW